LGEFAIALGGFASCLLFRYGDEGMQMLLLADSRERLLHQFRARDLAPAQQLTKLSNRHAVGSF
jgi:hypothetical protein